MSQQLIWDFSATMCFFAILTVMAALSVIQFIFSKDRSFLWYTLYITFTVLYYLRDVFTEILPHFDINVFVYGSFSWGATLGYITYIFYFLFLDGFLRLKEEQPIYHRFTILSITFLLVVLMINLLVQLSVDVDTSIQLHHWTRLLFLPVSLALAWTILVKARVPQHKYILIGSAFLTLGGLFSGFRNVIPSELSSSIWFGTIAYIEIDGFYVYCISTRMGILLELIFFSIALTIRYKHLIKEANLKAEEYKLELLKQDKEQEPCENPFLKRVNKIIWDQLSDENFSVNQLCLSLNQSKSQVRKKIKKYTNKSTDLYIRSLRLSKAKALLAETDLTVAEISHETGFKDQSFFSRAFRKEYGLSPTSWRSSIWKTL